jgi:hypothetical protein
MLNCNTYAGFSIQRLHSIFSLKLAGQAGRVLYVGIFANMLILAAGLWLGYLALPRALMVDRAVAMPRRTS